MTASNEDKRLLFNGCQCGKCGRIFREDDHPDLPNDLLRSTDKLRAKVNALIDEHNLLRDLTTEGKEEDREDLYKEAMRKYAFYLCSNCKDPYFGGTIDCADEVRLASSVDSNSSSGTGTSLPETRLCPACAPQSQTICQNPSEHGQYLIWKCRYCCKPSTTVCYGNVHFCDDCHDKNSAGIILEAIPCSGDSCCYPKPRLSSEEHLQRRRQRQTNPGGEGFHCNGPSQDCEQVYSCVLCDSIGRGVSGSNVDSTSSYHDPLAIEVGSRNFLVNPSGEDGLEGWRQLNPNMSWRCERQDDSDDQIISPLLQTPVLGRNNRDGTSFRPAITTNFVSSFMDCAMAQTVDLKRVLRLDRRHHYRNSNIRIEVSARYTGRTDCPSVFALKAFLSDGELDLFARRRRRSRNNNNIPPFQQLSSEILEAPPGVYWERTSLEFEFSSNDSITWNRPMVTVIVIGKDSRFWRGNFGSKVADITLRLIGGTSEQISSLVKTPEEVLGSPEEDNLSVGNETNSNGPTRENVDGLSSSENGLTTRAPPRRTFRFPELFGAVLIVISGVLLSKVFKW
eukprot:CAMPEP_0197178710 /NCGR_PEP_ID=MMETSP1423-20130617/3915_1 /TAXON_ID=476441 /ORGANISM="Pseudo-nitzschia heimii, Strain UNC1101" /LENGTH=564 /DNA_ID=CAMNT_0042628513 /DNA_START=251 /DNA_END=1942 /DNA_ORIENTATION=-